MSDKQYFILTNKNEIKFVGEFTSFKEAWDYCEYEQNINFVWLFSKNKLLEIFGQIKSLTIN